MILRLLAFLALLLAATSAGAVEADTYCLTGTSSTGAPLWQPCAVGAGGGVVSTAPAIQGFGTLAATNASALLSTLTPGPNSAAWPAVPGQIYVINSASSAGLIYLCPKGGTCSAAVGIPISAGNAYGVYQGATTMTVIAASTATVVAQW